MAAVIAAVTGVVSRPAVSADTMGAATWAEAGTTPASALRVRAIPGESAWTHLRDRRSDLRDKYVGRLGK